MIDEEDAPPPLLIESNDGIVRLLAPEKIFYLHYTLPIDSPGAMPA